MARFFSPTLSIMKFWLQNWNLKNQYNVEYSNMLVSYEEKLLKKEVDFKYSNERNLVSH